MFYNSVKEFPLSLSACQKFSLLHVAQSRQDHTIFGAHYDEGRITRVLQPDWIWASLAKKSISRYRDLERETGINFPPIIFRLTILLQTTGIAGTANLLACHRFVGVIDSVLTSCSYELHRNRITVYGGLCCMAKIDK